MTTIDDMEAIKAAMGQYEMEVTAAATKTTTVLRHLLLPILHLWGMGMVKVNHRDHRREFTTRGGTAVYHLGTICELSIGSS